MKPSIYILIYKAERVYHQVCPIRNGKPNHSGRRKMLSDGNVNLHKGMEITGNGKRFFFLSKSLKKITEFLRNEILIHSIT